MSTGMAVNAGYGNDIEALRRYARGGDPRAFEALVHRYQAMVLATCRRTLGASADAEDAAQETFLKLARHAGEVGTSAAGWLHACAVRTSLDQRRRREARARAEGSAALRTDREEASRAGDETWSEVEPRLDAALATLREEDRDLILTRFMLGRSQSEMAGEAGVSRGSMHRKIDRAVDRLREALRAQGCPAAVAGGSGLTGAIEAHAATPVPAGMTGSFVKAGLAGLAAGGGGSGVGLAVKAGVLAVVLAAGGLGVAAWSGVLGFGPARAVWSAGPDYRLRSLRVAGVAVSRMVCDGTTLRFESNEPGQPPRVMTLTALRAGDRPGEIVARIDSTAMDPNSPFGAVNGMEVVVRSEVEGDSIALSAALPIPGHEERVEWFGDRDPGAGAPAAGGPAAALAGVWLERMNWDLSVSDTEIVIRSGEWVIEKYRILGREREGGEERLACLCTGSADRARIGKRVKVLMRREGDSITLAWHRTGSTKLDEYPEGLDGEDVVVQRWTRGGAR